MAIPFITQLPEAPQRSDARPDFALRADVFFAAIDPMRYQMNQMAAWMNDQRDDIYSYSDNVEAWMNATLAARNAAQAAATNAAASESAAKDHLDDTAALIAAFTPTGDPLPEVTSVNAPLVVATPQGGVKFSRRALNNGIGVRPALRFDFANQGYLDPRIEFTRASKDWDEYGNEYGIDEPVLTDKGLWVSGARTNRVIWSNDLRKESWSKIGLINVETFNGESRLIVAPGDDARLDQTIPVSDISEITISFWAKGNLPDNNYIQINNPETWANFGVNLTNEWRKYTFSGSVPSGQTNYIFRLRRHNASFGLDASIKNIQLEAGAASTSYIPTQGSQVTVATTTPQFQTDISSTGDFSFVFSFEQLAPDFDSSLLSINDGSSSQNNQIDVRTTYDTLVFRLRSGGVNIRTATRPSTLVGKLAFSQNGSQQRLFINGESIYLSGAYAVLPFFNLFFRIGFRPIAGALTMTGHVKGLTVFDKALSVTQLQELTS